MEKSAIQKAALRKGGSRWAGAAWAATPGASHLRPSAVGAALILLLAPALSAPAAAQEEDPPASAGAATDTLPTAHQDVAPVEYYVEFPNRAHHEARITVTFPALVDSVPLEVRMSRSSPGRYALHEFAKNVYDVEAQGAEGRRVRLTRSVPHGWTIAGHGGEVRLSYTLFGDRVDGTYTAIDGTHAHLNMPATFLWAPELAHRPVRITFAPPEGSGWRVATQLEATGDPFTFTAPSLDYFLDSPTELSRHDVREWTVESNGREYRIRIAAHHIDRQVDLDRYADMVRRIVDEQHAIFGELPDFETGAYTFIADYLPWASGDGMEHRNSTILTSTRALRTDARRLVGTVAHEFFHAWNIERIRPRELEPFDFQDFNMTDALWFGEGFTSYYDDLTLRRAGIIDDADFARRLGGAVSTVVNSPGRRFFSPAEMSKQALFADRASFADPTNQANTFTSYYTWGSVVGLALDLMLRSRDLELDGYMRLVWEVHGRPFVPYELSDLEELLGEYTGDPEFAADFFGRYVLGTEVPDLGSLLAQAGFLLRRARPGEATLGPAGLDFAPPGAVVREPTRIGTPLYRAGLDVDDRLLAVDGTPLNERRVLTNVLKAHRPGDTITLTFESHGSTRQVRTTLVEDATLEAVPYEAAGRELDEDMRAFRRRWLSSRAR